MQFSLLAKPKLRALVVQTVFSSKKYILTHFQKLMSFHLLMTQGSLVGKVWRKLFPSPKCSGPVLGTLTLNMPEPPSHCHHHPTIYFVECWALPKLCTMSAVILYEGTCRCNISLGHVPATFSCVCKCCDFNFPCYMSPLHVPATCHLSVYYTSFCRCSMSLRMRRVPATWHLVSAHL